jgi:hypothetical protein
VNLQSLTRRVRLPGHSVGVAAMPANAAALPGPAGRKPYQTAPIAVVRESIAALPVEEPPAPRFTRRHVPEAAELYARVLHGLRALPVPAPEPEPDWRARAARFTADMRKPRGGGLPLFRQTGLAVGWCGLEEIRPAGRHARWSTDRWARQAVAAIATATEAARAEIGHTADELTRQEQQIRDAADAALALGYPGGAL